MTETTIELPTARRITDPARVIGELTKARHTIEADYARLDTLRAEAHQIGTDAVSVAQRIGEVLDQAATIAGPKYFKTWAESLPFDLAIAEKFRRVRQMPLDSRQTWLALGMVPDRVDPAKDASDEKPEGKSKPAPHLKAIDEVTAWARGVKTPGLIERGDTRQLYAILHRWHSLDR
jgi:hypothetical protein